MRWSDFTATLSAADQVKLILALGAGLHEARRASEVATSNGEVEDVRRHLVTAIDHLADALALLPASAPD